MIRKYRIFLFALFALLAAQAMHAQSGIASRSFSGGMTEQGAEYYPISIYRRKK